MKRKINKNNFWITAVLAFFLFVQIPFLTGARYASWDESVYIGMAKHIYSSGQSGLWENFRPWVLPAFLGIFWKLGLDVVLFGKILALVFSCAVIYLVYLSGREMFDEKTGITASAITAITPVFFLNATNILAEIPSVMFALLSIYFILKRRPLLSGVFSASAFLTKFPQGIIAVVLAVLIFAYGKNKSNNKNSLLGAIRRLKPAVLRSSLNREFLELKTVGLKSEVLNSPVFNKRKTFKKNREMSNLLRFAAGFALVLSVGIALNFVFKNNFFVQLFKASLHQGNVFATESSSYFFYIAEIVKNNWLLLFSAAAFFAFVYSKTLKKNGKDGKNGKKSAKWLEHLEWLIVIFLVFLAYFSAIQNRQIRFSIIFL
ncbi:MAG TPA: glycosyltransferase family 39 protein, partial [Candidatus Nanoarchaeia archaeon]|nr:glycosyltransferase family 39 protein [Candidatus Nanoarchaeia archaeon]